MDNNTKCAFCNKYDCNCEESQALEWLMNQDDPPGYSAFDVARMLVRYRIEYAKAAE